MYFDDAILEYACVDKQQLERIGIFGILCDTTGFRTSIE